MTDGGDSTMKVVPQIPAEYDDLYLSNKSLGTEADFSLDINSKMKVPARLSVDGQYLHEMEVVNMRTAGINGATSNMAIPHHITLSGDERERLSDVYRDPYDLSTAKQYATMTTPPRVIAADTHSFPAIHEEEEERVVVKMEAGAEATMNTAASPQRKHLSATNSDVSMSRKAQTLESLERRVRELEDRESSRQRSERLYLYPAIALYVLYKLFITWRSS